MRLFVALHLVAVGTILALSVAIGGGFEGPPMPPVLMAAATLPVSAPLPAPPAPVADPSPALVRPEWTRRAEIAAPWESR